MSPYYHPNQNLHSIAIIFIAGVKWAQTEEPANAINTPTEETPKPVILTTCYNRYCYVKNYPHTTTPHCP